MDSFGAELPLVSSAWVSCRIVFMLMTMCGSAGGALLSLKPEAYCPDRRRLWGAVAAALFVMLWSVYAVFAPMFY
jgi:hypothetical protein